MIIGFFDTQSRPATQVCDYIVSDTHVSLKWDLNVFLGLMTENKRKGTEMSGTQKMRETEDESVDEKRGKQRRCPTDSE